jgi:hypothetical protein
MSTRGVAKQVKMCQFSRLWGGRGGSYTSPKFPHNLLASNQPKNTKKIYILIILCKRIHMSKVLDLKHVLWELRWL